MPNIPFVPEHKLIAYADGFLPPAEMAQIEHALTRSPALAKRVARIKQTRELAAASFDDTLNQPLPSAIEKAAAGAGVQSQGSLRAWQIFAAAGLLILGLVLGRLSAPEATSSRGTQIAIAGVRGALAGPELRNFLDAAATGQELILADGLPAKMILSFPSKGGNICRQFQLGADPALLNAVACRDYGDWRIEIVALARQAVADKTVSGLAPDPVNAVIDQIINGAPLDAEQERSAIAAKWRQ